MQKVPKCDKLAAAAGGGGGGGTGGADDGPPDPPRDRAVNQGGPKPTEGVSLLPQGGDAGQRRRRLAETTWFPPSAPAPNVGTDTPAAVGGVVRGGGSRPSGDGVALLPPQPDRRRVLARSLAPAPRAAARRLALFPPGDGPWLRPARLAPPPRGG